MGSPTEFLTLNTSEWHKDAEECLLSDTVEELAKWFEQAAEDARDNNGKPHVRVYFDEVTARDEYPDGLDYMDGEFLIGKQVLVSDNPKGEVK